LVERCRNRSCIKGNALATQLIFVANLNVFPPPLSLSLSQSLSLRHCRCCPSPYRLPSFACIRIPGQWFDATTHSLEFAGLEMGLKDFKIHFDSPYATYCPDQTVTGRVILTIDSIKKIKGKCPCLAYFCLYSFQFYKSTFTQVCCSIFSLYACTWYS
jgi:hypothetical protein